MHYQFKAMQKAMASVGVSNSLADRPVYRQLKEIASITNHADVDRTVIDNIIKNIEGIIITIKNTHISSEKVKAVMEPINRQIIEALEAYLSAWRMMITFHDEKFLEKIKEEKIEEQVIPDEDMDECPDDDEDYEESETDKVYNRILMLAENAEITLQDAEKLMKETFDDNNMDGE
ncbi:MAG: hypothetical protein ABRQ37_20340 [Candidatus Eremiobacterota bacterium]